MNRILFLLIAGVALISCEKQAFDFQGSTSESEFYSRIIDDDMSIHTYLPPNYNPNDAYPVIFLLDGHWYFDDFSKELSDLIQGGDMEPSILIGIGYQEKVNEKRFRDYTFPQDPDYDIENGRADRFSQFLKDELIPHMESEYGTDSSKYVLIGHSLGGLNTLYNMFSLDSPFRGYVAVSSSVWWSDAFLFGWEEQFASNAADLPAKAYIAVGGDEPPSMTTLNEELIERLKERDYDGLSMSSEFFTGASHSQVPILGFKKGVQFVLAQ
jgi:predicted alpha/beta superfamily hydrolase